MSVAPSPGPEVAAPVPDPGPERNCGTCRGRLNRIGPQPMRTGGVESHPEAVLWLDTYWCPACGKVEFYTVP